MRERDREKVCDWKVSEERERAQRSLDNREVMEEIQSSKAFVSHSIKSNDEKVFSSILYD